MPRLKDNTNASKANLSRIDEAIIDVPYDITDTLFKHKFPSVILDKQMFAIAYHYYRNTKRSAAIYCNVTAIVKTKNNNTGTLTTTLKIRPYRYDIETYDIQWDTPTCNSMIETIIHSTIKTIHLYMKKITSKTINKKQIKAVNEYMGYTESTDDKVLSNHGYAFYYNQMDNGLDLCDADRYANLNTILGYDVGIKTFRVLDSWLWTHGFDLMELVGSNEDKTLLQQATTETKTKPLDYSKWTDYRNKKYTYSYFEHGIQYK